ncbi:hypothetical protein O181_132413 [Austropuccinia psidii MF-1]|uniref:Chromo domain-containing protein n=1 Tax=Austropuccinia psidii MF-1 TaxID=1389203 RepID=A0A9Q3QBM5_9BASI|nr:hypothetical protein [Austropuccinia psidii MF-1]
MRDSFVGPFTINKVIGKTAVEVKLTEEFLRKHPVLPNNPTPPEVVEVRGSPGPVKKIVKGRKIRLNAKDQKQYLVRFKNQTKDTDKWLSEDAIPYGNLHLRRLRAASRTEKSHK